MRSASADSSGFPVNELDYRATRPRRLDEGSLALSGFPGTSDFEPVGSVSAAMGDQDFRSLSLGYQRPGLGGRGRFTSSVQWSDGSGRREWERWQVRFGFSYDF